MAKSIETPQEHSSLVGGSTASRRINCPRSYALEQIAPKSKGSAYAREGTALHEMMAVILDKDKDPEDLLPFTHDQPAKGIEDAWTLTIDHDLWEQHGAPALEMFEDFLDQLEAETGADAVYYIEKKFAFPGIDDAFGTSDVVFKCGNIGGIWDWKFGRRHVSAKENQQLMFYFASAREAMPDFFADTDDLRLCISQPQCNETEPEVWETDHETINDFVKLLQRTIKSIEKLGRGAKIKKGKWCDFADCKLVCPLHVKASADLGKAMKKLDLHQNRAEGTPPVIKDMGEFMADAMELAEMAESWAKKVAAMTSERLENGMEVPGWKVVAKRSSGKDWLVDTDTAKKRLASRGLKAADYLVTKVITVPQAIKKLKKLGKELPEELYEVKPSSGVTLTREGDPRPSAATPASRAAALGSALLKATGDEEE